MIITAKYKKQLRTLKIILVAGFLFFIFSVQATGAIDGEGENAGALHRLADYYKIAGWEDASSEVASNSVVVVIKAFLSLLGLVFLLLTVYAGFRWMTAGGNEEQVTEAKKLLINSAIGLGIVFLAYVITYTIIGWLGQSSGYETGFTDWAR